MEPGSAEFLSTILVIDKPPWVLSTVTKSVLFKACVIIGVVLVNAKLALSVLVLVAPFISPLGAVTFMIIHTCSFAITLIGVFPSSAGSPESISPLQFKSWYIFIGH